ncbi:hypothetical protein BKA64DRAFT_646522 [Cadophora sp. MPI-SDFR-AT-0126]|nr:hypothetical protein BKA64DRAFT_646522 [Leotiomycetes sp. MPI-SDFR-AT-0126]
MAPSPSSKSFEVTSSTTTSSASSRRQSSQPTSRLFDPLLEGEVEYDIKTPGAQALEKKDTGASTNLQRWVTRSSDCSKISHGDGRARVDGKSQVWVPITQFALFPKVPLELRACWSGSSLYLLPKSSLSFTKKYRGYSKFTALEKQNFVRQFNKEARAEALNVQTLAHDEYVSLGASGTYVNTNVDIFYVAPTYLGEPYSVEDCFMLQSLRRVALPAYQWYIDLTWDDHYKLLFSFLTDMRVEEIFIIVGSDNAWSCADKVFIELRIPPPPPEEFLDRDVIGWMSMRAAKPSARRKYIAPSRKDAEASSTTLAYRCRFVTLS